MEQQRPTLRTDLTNVVRGFCMGAADTVPGVSGGTVALILGHYRRLVTAISRIDRRCAALLGQRRWAEAAGHCDFRFLVALGLGVVTGIGCLASLMHWLLENQLPGTLAVFFGLVLASAVVVGKRITAWGPAALAILAAAAFAAFWLCGQSGTHAEPGKLYLFAAAMIAICAMILPGISGAFVMLLLGVYHPVTGLVKDFVRGNWSLDGIVTLTLFAGGCLLGLALFSRLLRWLLQAAPNRTYAALLGLMLGSLRRLWPLQAATPATAALPFKEREWELIAPTDWAGPILPLLGLLAGAFVVVLWAEQWGLRNTVDELAPATADTSDEEGPVAG